MVHAAAGIRCSLEVNRLVVHGSQQYLSTAVSCCALLASASSSAWLQTMTDMLPCTLAEANKRGYHQKNGQVVIERSIDAPADLVHEACIRTHDMPSDSSKLLSRLAMLSSEFERRQLGVTTVGLEFATFQANA